MAVSEEKKEVREPREYKKPELLEYEDLRSLTGNGDELTNSTPGMTPICAV